MPVILEHCPLCKHRGSKPYYKYVYPAAKMVNVVCVNCGLVYLNPRPDFSELTEYYASYSSNTQPGIVTVPHWFVELVQAIARQRLEYLAPFLGDGGRVLDIGCSFGAMMNVLKTESGKSLEVTGVNPEEGYARFGREMYGLDIRVGMFEEQDFEPRSFDLIILDNVIEHLVNPSETTNNIYKLLDEGGRFYVVTNDLDRPHGFLWRNYFPDHTVTFSPNTLGALLESTGFNVLDMNEDGHVTCEGYHYPYIQCVAEKGVKPAEYDFHTNGDDADMRIAHAKSYTRKFLSTDGVAKRLYEYRLKNSNAGNSLVERGAKLLSKYFNVDIEYTPMGHTPPMEKYFFRRIAFCVCETMDDTVAVQSLLAASVDDINPIIYVLSRHASNDGFAVVTRPTTTGNEPIPALVKDPKKFLLWLTRAYPHISELIYIVASHGTLEDDQDLQNSHIEFRRSDKDVMVFGTDPGLSDEPFAAPSILKWMILDGSRLDDLLSIRLEEAMQEFSDVDTAEVRRRIAKRRKHHRNLAKRESAIKG